MLSLSLAGAALLFVASAAQAALPDTGIAPYSCRNGSFPSEQGKLVLAHVAGRPGDELPVYTDDRDCPEGGEQCKSSAYLRPDDELLVNKVSGDWACAWFNGKSGETVGWVPAKRLQVAPKDADPEAARWLGKWKYGEDTIEITRLPGPALRIRGKATWYGLTNAQGEQVIHVGSMDGTITPTGDKASFSQDGWDCNAAMTLVGQYLVVTDNGRCGGVNVRFDGVYTK